MHRPFYPREKRPLYPLNRRLGVTQNLSGPGGKEKDFCRCWESNPSRPPHNSVTILTELRRLLGYCAHKWITIRRILLLDSVYIFIRLKESKHYAFFPELLVYISCKERIIIQEHCEAVKDPAPSLCTWPTFQFGAPSHFTLTFWDLPHALEGTDILSGD
jgi:hypothetical protein